MARQMIATVGVQCFIDLKLIIMGLRYHLRAISVRVAAVPPRVPIPMFSGESGAVRRDRHEDRGLLKRSKARHEANES